MPVYNVRPFLSHAIESVLGQSLDAFELIAIDDGSTDGYADLLDEYAACRPRQIKVIHQANAGMAAARNRGLDLARGTYIAFLDSDDYVAPDFYAALYERADTEGAEICRGEYIIVDSTGQQHPCLRNGFIRSHGRQPMLFNEGFWTAIYRRSFLSAHGIRFPAGINTGSDIMLLHQAALHCSRLSLEDQAFYYYRHHSDSDTAGRLSRRKMSDIMHAHRFILESVYRHQTRISPEVIGFLYLSNIKALLGFAGRTQTTEDARQCRGLAMYMLERCPCPARASVARQLHCLRTSARPQGPAAISQTRSEAVPAPCRG